MRAGFFLCGFLIVLLLATLARGATRLVLRHHSPQDLRVRRWLFRAWGRLTLGAIGLRVSVRGSVPQRPFFLVSNHLGYLDIAVLSSLLDAVFVAKSDVRAWPLLGPAVSLFDTIFVNRTRRADVPRVNVDIAQALARGDGVVMFPEATSSDGADVLPFKPALLAYPATAALPVACAALRYGTASGEPPAATALCWWGDMPFLPHLLGLLGVRGKSVTVTFADAPVQDGDRKRLAVRLRDAVVACLPPAGLPVMDEVTG